MRHECEKWLGDRWCAKSAVDYVERDCGDTDEGCDIGEPCAHGNRTWLCAEHCDEWIREGGEDGIWQSEDTGTIN